MLTARPSPLKRQPWYEHIREESEGSILPCDSGASLPNSRQLRQIMLCVLELRQESRETKASSKHEQQFLPMRASVLKALPFLLAISKYYIGITYMATPVISLLQMGIFKQDQAESHCNTPRSFVA